MLRLTTSSEYRLKLPAHQSFSASRSLQCDPEVENAFLHHTLLILHEIQQEILQSRSFAAVGRHHHRISDLISEASCCNTYLILKAGSTSVGPERTFQSE